MVTGDGEACGITETGVDIGMRAWHAKIGKQAKLGFAHAPVLELQLLALPARHEPCICPKEPSFVAFIQGVDHAPKQRAIKRGVTVLEYAQDPLAGGLLVMNDLRMNGRFQTPGVGKAPDRLAQADKTQQM
ncbi:hypothetical protein D3C86_1825610 [compost metagenome]